MANNKFEAVKEASEEIKKGTDDITIALGAFGVPVSNNSFLCPLPEHNDHNNGNVYIYKNSGAYCFRCRKHISSVDIAMKYGGMTWDKAVEYVWCDLWGRELNYPKNGKKSQITVKISLDDYKFIGLPGAMDSTVTYQVGECYYDVKVPGKDKRTRDDNNICKVMKTDVMDSLNTLLAKGDEMAIEIVIGKAKATKDYYKNQIKDTDSKVSKSNLSVLCRANPAYAEDMRNLLKNCLDHADRILKEAYRVRKYYRKIAQK